MVAWDNPRCIYQWFHLEWLELDTPPTYIRTYIKNLLLPRLAQPAVDFGVLTTPRMSPQWYGNLLHAHTLLCSLHTSVTHACAVLQGSPPLCTPLSPAFPRNSCQHYNSSEAIPIVNTVLLSMWCLRNFDDAALNTDLEWLRHRCHTCGSINEKNAQVNIDIASWLNMYMKEETKMTTIT